MPTQPLPIAVLISGYGSNLQALIDAIDNQQLPAKITLVISDQPTAQGLERAKQAGIPTAVIDRADYPDRTAFDNALQQHIERSGAQLVVLAGFMRILGAQMTNHFYGRLVNIHPSLLPKHPGLNTHQRAIDAHDKEHGTTVHLVTEGVDEGPILAQARTTILPDDTADTLKTRVQRLEHTLYPTVIRWFAENRVRVEGKSVHLDLPKERNPQ